MATRKELLLAVIGRYRGAGAAERTRILDEFVAVTGYHRKHAVRLLNATPATGRSYRRRNRLYDEAVTSALLLLWEAGDRPCSKPLKALIPTLIHATEQHGHLALDPTVRERLMQVSAATIDRLLSTTRMHSQRRRGGSGADLALRRAIPVRTFGDWNDPPPGFFEMDMVEHCGGAKTDGSFVHTLVLTDIATTWTECIAMPMRNQALVVAALDATAPNIPFPMRGLDTDNDSAFINETTVAYCKDRGLVQTRSRPYRKNDQAWVEQKNGAVVRKLVGYERFSGLAATRAMAALYASSRLYVNFFQPSFKLKSKQRDGARVTKEYYPAATPYTRVMSSHLVSDAAKEKLTETFHSLDPVKLLRDMRLAQEELRELVDHQPPKDAERPLTPVSIYAFLAGLAVAWKDGEVRPTHRRRTRAPRTWRTRKDPIGECWPALERWLLEDPTLTAQDLLDRMQSAAHETALTAAQLRTLQRRVKVWRSDRAKYLILGPEALAAAVAAP